MRDTGPKTPESAPSPPCSPPGGHRARLEALRDRLEAAIEVSDPNMLPQLAGQYRATLDDIAKLDAQAPQAGIQDDLRKRREQRRAKQRTA